MPRYVVQRTFPQGFELPADTDVNTAFGEVITRNTEHDVTWVHSYVTADKHGMFCVYDAPSPEAIRTVAGLNELPVDQITEVRVLDPYFYS